MEIEKLLARIIETGPELPGAAKQVLRGHLYQLMASIGIDNHDFSQLAAVYQRLNDRLFNLPSSPGYPEKENFIANFVKILKRQGNEAVPALPGVIQATGVARYAQADWQQVAGRGGTTTVDYLFEMGKIISSEFGYTSFFDDRDMLEIGQGWQVANGRHRSLTLRVLGEKYAARRGLNNWVEVKKV